MPIRDTAANEAALTRLCDALRTERVIGVMGAGISNWAGYDTWDAVLGRLAEEVTAVKGNPAIAADISRLNENKLHQAQKLGDQIGNVAFQEFIRREFALPGKPVHEVIKNLVWLPLSHFLTLNFDSSGELSHDAVGFPYRTLLPRTAYYLLQLMNGVLSFDPVGVLRMAAAICRAGSIFRFEIDMSARDEAIKLVEAALADHRDSLKESAQSVGSLLDVFAKAGWSEAIALTFRLDEAFR